MDWDVPWKMRWLAAILLGAYLIQGVAYHALVPPGQDITLRDVTVFQGFMNFLMVAFTLLVVRRHGRSVKTIGITSENLLQNIKIGILTGAVILIIGQGADEIISSFLGKSPTQQWLFESAKDPVALPYLILFGSVFAPIAEEVFFRGFAYPAFRKAWGVNVGIIASSVLFALAHLDPLAFVALAIVGTGLAWLFEKTGSIIPCITAHFFFNTTSFLLAFFGVL